MREQHGNVCRVLFFVLHFGPTAGAGMYGFSPFGELSGEIFRIKIHAKCREACNAWIAMHRLKESRSDRGNRLNVSSFVAFCARVTVCYSHVNGKVKLFLKGKKRVILSFKMSNKRSLNKHKL